MAEWEDDCGDEDEGGGAAWLTTWADMMSVLLTFFIVLQAFSTISERKFFEAVSSIQRAFRVPLPVRAPGNLMYDSQSRTAEDFETMLRDEGVEGISVEDYGDRLVFTVDTGLLFGPGRADLSPEGERMLASLGGALAGTAGNIRVEGHTDDVPPGSGNHYASNWWLSCARAVSALEALQRSGVTPERLSAAGYGEYDPIAPNDGEENRRKNRRVEFVVEKGTPLADTSTRGP